MSVQTLANVQTLEPTYGRHNNNGKLHYSWAVDLGTSMLDHRDISILLRRAYLGGKRYLFELMLAL